ncbi:hypothetical protein Tco_0490684 [Tanacetum coccineum]
MENNEKQMQLVTRYPIRNVSEDDYVSWKIRIQRSPPMSFCYCARTRKKLDSEFNDEGKKQARKWLILKLKSSSQRSILISKPTRLMPKRLSMKTRELSKSIVDPWHYVAHTTSCTALSSPSNPSPQPNAQSRMTL